MNLSELLVLLQYEIQKSYDFVEDITRAEGKDTSVLHIAIEMVEIELPITVAETQVTFDPKKVEKLPLPVKKLSIPYKMLEVVKRGEVPQAKFKGQSVAVGVVGPTEKKDKEITKEQIGRIKVVLRPILR
jgi:hypothetical protein